MLARRTKGGNKVPDVKAENPGDSVQHNGESYDGSEVLKDTYNGESCSIPEEQTKNLRGKGREELKPPRVLEALSASELRALRYAREGISQVVALDNDKGNSI